VVAGSRSPTSRTYETLRLPGLASGEHDPRVRGRGYRCFVRVDRMAVNVGPPWSLERPALSTGTRQADPPTPTNGAGGDGAVTELRAGEGALDVRVEEPIEGHLVNLAVPPPLPVPALFTRTSSF
jgi:hypothetical protein